MKRTATLVAGLLLVTGTVFAAESKLDFGGTVIKAKTNVIQTTASSFNDDSNGDTDLVLKATYKVDDKTTVTLGYNTDDDGGSTADRAGELLVNRKEGKVEAQFDATLNFNNDGTTTTTRLDGYIDLNGDGEYDPADEPATYITQSGVPTSLPFIQEDNSSDKTFIKYNHTKDLAVTFYPFNMGLATGTVFDDDDYNTQIPGLVLNYGKAYVGLGIDAVDGVDTEITTPSNGTQVVNVMAIKAGYSTEVAGAKLTAKYSGAFWDKDKLADDSVTPTGAYEVQNSVLGTNGRLGTVTQDINVHVDYKLATKVSLEAEVGYNKLYDTIKLNKAGITPVERKDISSGFGLSVKGTYAMSNILAPYAQVKYTTDGYLSYGDMQDWNLDVDLLATGGVAEFIAGADYKLTEKLTLNGEAKLQNAGEKLFSNGEENEKEKSAFTLAASATFTF